MYFHASVTSQRLALVVLSPQICNPVKGQRTVAPPCCSQYLGIADTGSMGQSHSHLQVKEASQYGGCCSIYLTFWKGGNCKGRRKTGDWQQGGAGWRLITGSEQVIWRDDERAVLTVLVHSYSLSDSELYMKKVNFTVYKFSLISLTF